MTIAELAKASGLTVDTVRYYARIQLIKPIRHKNNGYRDFSQHDIRILKFICRAKRLGFTLRDIRQILCEVDDGNSPCEFVRDAMQQRIDDTRCHVEKLNRLLKRMEMAQEQWEHMTNCEPNDDVFCVLIESFEPKRV